MSFLSFLPYINTRLSLDPEEELPARIRGSFWRVSLSCLWIRCFVPTVLPYLASYIPLSPAFRYRTSPVSLMCLSNPLDVSLEHSPTLLYWIPPCLIKLPVVRSRRSLTQNLWTVVSYMRFYDIPYSARSNHSVRL